MSGGDCGMGWGGGAGGSRLGLGSDSGLGSFRVIYSSRVIHSARGLELGPDLGGGEGGEVNLTRRDRTPPRELAAPVVHTQRASCACGVHTQARAPQVRSESSSQARVAFGSSGHPTPRSEAAHTNGADYGGGAHCVRPVGPRPLETPRCCSSVSLKGLGSKLPPVEPTKARGCVRTVMFTWNCVCVRRGCGVRGAREPVACVRARRTRGTRMRLRSGE